MEPILFERFPVLRGGIPHRGFLAGPTPVDALPCPGLPDGRLWVKRDERSCPLYGGNKPRKLEFVIGHALARGARRLITTGGLGTNHGLATTILGRAVGLPTTLALLDQPVTDAVRAQVRTFVAYGATLRYGGGVPGVVVQTLGALAVAAVRGERPYLVATGGSSTRGTLGFVSAGLELAEQVRSGVLPEPAHLFVAVGTGGSLAGLAVGVRLGGLDTRLTGVVVTDVFPPSRRRIARAADASLAFLRRAGAIVSTAAPPNVVLVRDQIGPGYGAPTAAAAAAVDAARAVGLRLETTYTGKCLAAIFDRAAQHASFDGPVLFWNTFNDVDVVAQAPCPIDACALPRALERRLVRAR